MITGMNTPPPRIELREVSKTFTGEGRRVTALDGLSFSVGAGEFVTLIGPSGSGKSTIFNLIAGLIAADGGDILIDGEKTTSRTGRVGYMPQRDLLLPWRTVTDNAIIPLEVQGMPREAAREQARALLPRFGLEGFAEDYPSALSGGMRGRAALLRTLLTGADILLLDEPFGALDALTRRELQDWLLGVWEDMRKTILFITHDVDEAVYLADRVIALSARPGRVVRELPVTLPRPRRQGMVADPAFGAIASELLKNLGINA